MRTANRLIQISTVLLFVLLSLPIASQPPLFKTPAYINHYSEVAIEQMIEFKIPASVIMAQAICESNCGTSILAAKANNHFGIKCHVGWQGDTILKTDDELNECFRSYKNVRESYTDHSLFLKNRPRYATLFTIPINDYKAWCRGLKNAGYATNYSYAEDLIHLIEFNKLFELDAAEILIGGIYQAESSYTDIKIKDRSKQLTSISVENMKWFFRDLNGINVSEINLHELKEEQLIKNDGKADELDIAGSKD